MVLPFELHSGTSATYAWSSHVARFATLTPVERKAIPKFLGSISSGVAVWESAAEFRAFATLVHEVVHYFQDLTTGMGTWDFLKRRENAAQSLWFLREAQGQQARGNIRSVRDMFSLAQDKVKELNSKCVYVPTSDFPPERREKLRQGMSACVGKEAPAEDVVPFLVENMLESEAAAVTFSTIRDLRMTDEQWEIARDNGQLWLLGEMPDVYTHTIGLLEGIFEHWMGTPMDELRKEVVDAFQTLAVFLIDLCWAHPDPEYFEDTGVDDSQYEPGLKLMRLLVRLQRATSAEAEAFQGALWKERDLDKAEALLIANCGFAYLPVRQVYERWCGYLGKLCQSDDNRLLKARSHVCERRKEHADGMVIKRFGYFFDAQIDLHYMANNGIQSWWTSPNAVDPDEIKMVFADLMSLNRDLGIIDYLVGGGAFVCPFAEARTCDAARDTCKTGITMAGQFPETKICLIRKFLESNRLPLGRFQ